MSSIHEIVDQLKGALVSAKAKILQQRTELEALSREPRRQAVVVAIREGNVRVGNAEEFIVGTRVRVEAMRETRHPEMFIGRHGTVTDDLVFERSDEYDVAVRIDGTEQPFNFSVMRPRGKDTYTNMELSIVEERPAVIVNYQGTRLELVVPHRTEVAVGDTVVLSPKSMQIVDVVPDVSIGSVGTIKTIVDTSHCEVDWEGDSRVVVHGVQDVPPEKGDRVILDQTGSVIVRSLGRGEERFLFGGTTDVTWADIGGLEQAKAELREAVELPYTEPELFAHHKYQVPKGVLLYGPPRCGKTLCGKAVASAMAECHGVTGDARGFFYVKGSEILDRYVGVTEGLIASLFNRARHFKRRTGYPATIFIDECEAIMAKRGSGKSSDILNTIVPAFLAEMDGLDETGAIVLLATNRPDMLDPAIVGDGRVDRRIKITRPDKESARVIAGIHIKKATFDPSLKTDEAVDIITREFFVRERVMRRLTVATEKETRVVPLALSDIINGAMIVSLISHARSFALRRDRERKTLTGITEADLIAAADKLVPENMDVSHDYAIQEVVERLPSGTRLIDIRKPKQEA